MTDPLRNHGDHGGATAVYAVQAPQWHRVSGVTGVLVMLEKLYHHCDRARFGNSVRITFFDFSSAFNTIQPHLLIQKLLDHDIPGSLLAWILNYLTDRSQYVRITCNGTLSHCLKSNTGAPQGTVLAPFYLLYIHLTVDLVNLHVR